MSSGAEKPLASSPKKKLIINAFVESCSGHQSPGQWRNPKDESWKFNDIQHWVKLAKLLEEGKFHGIFIADVLVSHNSVFYPSSPQIPYRIWSNPFNRAPMMCIRGLATQLPP